MKEVKAQSYLEVICKCPECGSWIDILNIGQTKIVLGSDLRAQGCDMEITCQECGGDFIVSDITY